MNNATKTIKIINYKQGQSAYTTDVVATEEPLEIRMEYGVNGNRIQKNISVTMRTPGNDKELALGFLFTEGIIKNYNDVNQIKHLNNDNNIILVELKEQTTPEIDKLDRNFYTTSSCGVCGKSSIESIKIESKFVNNNFDFKVEKDLLLTLPKILRTKQLLFESTGGIHASALFTADGELLLLKEDVGRHNALDKLIGEALQRKIEPVANSILLLSGRASFELIQKAAMVGISFVAAVGAPSSLAVELAIELNITLIGFLKESKFNVYSCQERIK